MTVLAGAPVADPVVDGHAREHGEEGARSMRRLNCAGAASAGGMGRAGAAGTELERRRGGEEAAAAVAGGSEQVPAQPTAQAQGPRGAMLRRAPVIPCTRQEGRSGGSSGDALACACGGRTRSTSLCGRLPRRWRSASGRRDPRGGATGRTSRMHPEVETGSCAPARSPPGGGVRPGGPGTALDTRGRCAGSGGRRVAEHGAPPGGPRRGGKRSDEGRWAMPSCLVRP